MNFTGLGTGVLLQAGAVLGAIVVVFYILKLKRRPIAVPFGPLWKKILRDKEATSWFSQLKRLLSLLIQLAIVTALLLALGDPQPVISEDEGRHVVVLIDASASMKAIDVLQPPGSDEELEEGKKIPKRTRLDVGVERIRDMVKELSGTDRLLIAQMDAAVTPLSTMTSEIGELEAALDQVRASDVRAQYTQGLRFAVDALRGTSKPEILIVSDGALGDPIDGAGGVELGDVKLSYIGVGEGGRNVAISGFSVRRYPLDKSRYEVMIEVTNTSKEPADVDLELFGDGKLTDIVSIRIHPKESMSRFYKNLSGAREMLEARITLQGDDPDQLPADDKAFALLPERRRARVQVVTKGNMYLEAALLLDEYLEVTTVKPSGYPAAGVFDVTIFDNVAPALAEGTRHVIYLNPKKDDYTPFKLGDKIKPKDGNFQLFDEVDTKHEIMRHLALLDVNISAARELVGKKKDKALAKSFDGDMLIVGKRGDRRFLALGFDIRESDFPLRISWPLFLLNTINFFQHEEVNYLSSYRTGEVWHTPAIVAEAACPDGKAPDEETEAEEEARIKRYARCKSTAKLMLPTGESQTVPIKDSHAVYLGQHAGIYELTLGQGDKAETMKFAANLSDPMESAIEPAKELAVGMSEAGEVEAFAIGVRRQFWIYLLAAVLAVTGIEWLTYHRRLTV